MILELVQLTTGIAEQRNPILDVAHLATRIAKRNSVISLIDIIFSNKS